MKKQIYINTILFITLLAVSLAWMITYASSGEITEYHRQLIIPSINLDINMYRLVDGEYEEITEGPLIVSNFAPNDVIQFKFEIMNNDEKDLTTDIILSDIEGDLEILKNKIFFIGTSPYEVSLPLYDSLVLKNSEYSIKFYNNVKVPGNSTVNLYWQIYMDKSASNEVSAKSLTINSIVFVQP